MQVSSYNNQKKQKATASDMLTAIGEGKKLSADYDQHQQLKGVFISTVHGRYQETNSSDVNYFIYFLFFSKENEGNRRQGQKAERDCQLLLEW